MNIDKLVVIGFGLIGASVAAGTRKNKTCREVIAIARSENTRQTALDLNLADRAYDSVESIPETLSANDLVCVAVPTLTTEKIFTSLAKIVPSEVTITDCASVKGSIRDAAIKAYGEMPPQLILGHPIAGSEQSGVNAANPELYQQHKVILAVEDCNDRHHIDRVKKLWSDLGADVLEMPVEEHDAVLAATSHLPHVIAYSLVDTLAHDEENENIFRYAAGGFKDFTRIASSDPTMWHDIMLANRESILRAIDLFANNLDVLRTAIDKQDSQQLMDTFTRAKQARDQFSVQLAQSKDKPVKTTLPPKS